MANCNRDFCPCSQAYGPSPEEQLAAVAKRRGKTMDEVLREARELERAYDEAQQGSQQPGRED